MTSDIVYDRWGRIAQDHPAMGASPSPFQVKLFRVELTLAVDVMSVQLHLLLAKGFRTITFIIYSRSPSPRSSPPEERPDLPQRAAQAHRGCQKTGKGLAGTAVYSGCQRRIRPGHGESRRYWCAMSNMLPRAAQTWENKQPSSQ